MPEDHNKIIKRIVNATLLPLGWRHQGQSRLWYLDRRWCLSVIEFQPKSGYRGTFLNIGVNLLWSPQPHISYQAGVKDHNIRATPFHEYIDDQQFESEVNKLTAFALTEADKLKNKFLSPAHVTRYLSENPKVGMWHKYYWAFAEGLSGNFSEGKNRFKEITKEEGQYPWQIELQKLCSELSLIETEESFKNRALEIIRESRAQLKLPEMPILF